MTKRMIEYAVLTLVVVILLLLGFHMWWSSSSSPICTNCAVTSLPQQRQECEKQFAGGYGSPRLVQPGTMDDYTIGFYDPAYSFGSTTTSSSGTVAAPPVAGYVMVRARPYSGYDSSSGIAGAPWDPAKETQGREWGDVRVAVVEFETPLRNRYACIPPKNREVAAVLFGDKFESYCDLPTRFDGSDPPKLSYRVFVINDSSSPVEYCIVSNCDESHGKICQVEINTVQ